MIIEVFEDCASWRREGRAELKVPGQNTHFNSPARSQERALPQGPGLRSEHVHSRIPGMC